MHGKKKPQEMKELDDLKKLKFGYLTHSETLIYLAAEQPDGEKIWLTRLSA